MRKLLVFLPFIVFIGLGSVLYKQLGTNPEYMPSALIGKPVPDFRLVSLQTDTVQDQTSLPKQAYLLNFWATWCPTCEMEHAYLRTLAKQGIPIVGIDYKDGKHKAQQWLATKGNPYQWVLTDELGKFGVDMGVTGAPETFVVNSKGIIVYRYQGALDDRVWQEMKGYLK
ncbi:MAG: DsbE family thiol:disulfide interchange protein [Marinomonas sp.]